MTEQTITSAEFSESAAKEKLNALSKALDEINTSRTRGINIFDAVGMRTQEIRHSTFLAWLLDPKTGHGLRSKFLTVFMENLLHYEQDFGAEGYLSNRRIMSAIGISSIRDLRELLEDNKISVLTERTLTLDGDDGRIDIFIESEAAKTLIVIENKVFTSTHDDQLNRYVAEFNDRSDWKKIFIYLTPEGDLPYDINGKYDGRWCISSYGLVLDAVRTVLADVHNTKLKILMGDYIEMVDTDILKNNKELKILCDDIRKKHKDAIELLLYYTDIAERVNRHCERWLRDNIPGISDVRVLPTRTDFCTENIKKYFSANGETWELDETRHKFTYRLSCKDGPLVGLAFMEKNSDKNADWDPVQRFINERLGQSKKPGNIYCTVFKTEKLLDGGFRDRGFEEIKEQLEKGLFKFKQKIAEFENNLSETRRQ